ncbi:MAG: glutathione S-transferase [Myxococcaceae bacterium]|nr:glutathione S-transferase [Myxococcaceae bacterium]MCI0669353.1 glutathione S-transferase [Myxococcaceae bacterium]
MLPVLYHSWFSPPSEKARWALDHHRVPHVRRVHMPIVGEPALRLRTGRWTGRLTVPVLVVDGRVLGDSLDIARYADEVGQGSPLFPREYEQEIQEWVQRSEVLVSAGRVLVSARIARSPAALLETLPVALRRTGVVADRMGRMGMELFARKYGLRDEAPALAEATMRSVLDVLRNTLRDGRKTLLGRFTFADIAMAATLQGVRPVDHPAIQLGPATREAWTDPVLASAYPEVLAWRDALYAQRPAASAPSRPNRMVAS